MRNQIRMLAMSGRFLLWFQNPVNINQSLVKSYLNTLRLIENRESSSSFCLPLFTIRLLITVSVVNAVILLMLYVVEPQSLLYQLTFYDFGQLEKLPSIFSLMYASLMCFAAYMYRIFFYQIKASHFVMQQMRVICFEQNYQFMLNPSPMRVWVLKQNVINMIWVYRVALVLMEIYMATVYLRNLVKMIQCLWWNPIWWPKALCLLLSMHLFALTNLIGLFSFFAVATLATIHTLQFGWLAYIRFSILSKQVIKLSCSNSGQLLARLSSFCHEHNLTLVFCFSVLGPYSRAMLVFMLTNFPMNTTIIMALLMTDIEGLDRTVFWLLWGCQLASIVIFHLFIIGFTYYIHKPFKRVIALSIAMYHNQCPEPGRLPKRRTNRRFSQTIGLVLSQQMRLANYISHLHTKNRYGLTYGPSGLVTMMAFAKCIMLYAEFLMYNYTFYSRAH